MKFSFERVPSNIEEANEILDMFDKAKIVPPQRIKDIIFDAVGRGFATSQEQHELTEYLESLQGSGSEEK
jgi:hypothetical protein